MRYASLRDDEANEITLNIGGSSVYDGQWRHFAIVRNAASDRVFFYTDGQLDMPLSSGSPDPMTQSINADSSLNMYIGANHRWNIAGGTNEHFQGAIDDLRIYNRALTSDEISALSNPESLAQADLDQTVPVTVLNVNNLLVADAGSNQPVRTGDTVYLDGGGSADPDDDELTYSWTIVPPLPAGGTATLSDVNTVTPSFIPDVEGAYQVQLVVSDFIGPGEPDTVTITAASAADVAEVMIVDAADTIDDLPSSGVTTSGNQNALGNFLAQAINAIQADDIETAIEKLEKALERTDGCTLRGEADGNGPARDWITDDPDCAAQNEAHELLTDAIDLLTP